MDIDEKSLESVSGGGREVYPEDCCDDFVPKYVLAPAQEPCCALCGYFRQIWTQPQKSHGEFAERHSSSKRAPDWCDKE